MRRYVLNADRTTSLMNDLVEWSRRFETDDRVVARDTMDDGRIVSTVFLALDHNLQDSGTPLLFETMVFSNTKSLAEEWCQRCSTYSQALQQHKRGCWEAKRLAGVSKFDTP